MKLWRIDADYESEDGDTAGSVTFFAQTDAFKAHVLSVLDGWDIDVYEEELHQLTALMREALLCRPWPCLPTRELVRLASAPKAAAARDLAEILNKRQRSDWEQE